MTTTPGPTDLVGTWAFTREIEDRRAGERLTVDGTTELAVVTPDRVRWLERGTLHRGATDAPVSRELSVERRDATWTVLFADGRDFHPWSPGSTVVHPCGADTYTGRVDVEPGLDAWQVEWVVTGPAKDYTMRTRLSRRADLG